MAGEWGELAGSERHGEWNSCEMPAAATDERVE